MKRKSAIIFFAIACMATVIILVTAMVLVEDDCEPDYKKLFESIVCIECSDGNDKAYGTGFITEINPGVIVTCCHVVYNEANGMLRKDLRVYNYDKGKSVDAWVIGYDVESDVAIIGASELSFGSGLQTNTMKLMYGEDIRIIGNALDFGASVLDAVVSVPSVVIKDSKGERTYLMMSRAIEVGDSGAPVIDSHGRVTGMATFRIKANDTAANNIGFALSMDNVINTTERILNQSIYTPI